MQFDYTPLHLAATKMAGQWPKVPVTLLGAGPGDLGLMTLKGLVRLHQADVVMYDYLVAPDILALASQAELVCVGKRAGDHSVPQSEINLLMAEYAEQGKQVLRLKGGDPFIFGRGGEELELLAERGIDFEVIPGITAASGCAAYAGIPLTHRDHAQTALFVTGHKQVGADDLDWPILANPAHTLVVYMGVMRNAVISQELIAHGRDASTPVAVVERGTSDAQRVFTGQLASLGSLIEDNQVQSPALIIVGEVVTLADKLNWYQGAD